VRIVFDERWLAEGGIARYGSEIMERLKERAQFEPLGVAAPIRHPLNPLLISRALARKRGDLFWSPGFLPPASPAVPFVVTVHDLTHRHYYSRAHRLYYDWVLRPLIRRATRVITGSESARRELLDWCGLDPEKLHAIHHGVSPSFSARVEPHRPGFEYLFYVGNRREYKNIPRMLEAFAAARLPAGVGFLLSGRGDPALQALASRLGLAERVRFAGYIPEEALPAYYRGALATIYLSLYEGFGLPVVESMAVGTPVLCSNVTSLPEVAGGAALTVDPLRTDEIARGMEAIVTDAALRERCIADGFRNAGRFSWDRSAQQHWRVFEAAAGLEPRQ
jgi:glycosyltransferase involved in cell wall biosynthesis